MVSKVNGQTQVKQLTRGDLAHYCKQHGAPAHRVTPATILPFYGTSATAEILAGFFAKIVVLVEGPTEALSLPIYFVKAGLDPAREGVAIVPVQGKGNLARWRRLFEAYGIPCYTVFDNDQEDDGDGAKRRDALRAVGLPDHNVDAVLSTTDWQVETEYTVFGADYETALRSHFASYGDLEEAARAEGVDSKPFVARWVADSMDPASGDGGWDKIREMVDRLRSKFPTFSHGDSGG